LNERNYSNRYRIIDKLGSGGMAEVYKAEDTILNRTVAIKVLHSQFATQKDFVERLRREAQAAANLNHPNIVSIHDWGSEDHNYFIVMEYIEGKTLKEIIETEAPLSADKAIKITVKVCSALEFAHKREIVHRDVKPQNIMITPEGEIKVTDFGIARAGTATPLTQTGSIMGTAQYLSPEQAQGRLVQRTSDIYSLGIVLYEMLTGRPPFNGENPVSVAFKQVHEQPVSPRKINPDIPESLERVVLRALAKNPADRYQSALQMREDLSLVASGGEVAPLPAGLFASDETIVLSSKRKKRKRISTPAAPWIVLAVLVPLVAFVVFALGSGLNLSGSVVTPNLEGKTVAEARQALRGIGLKLQVTERSYSSAVKSGLIMDQEPAAGIKASKSSAVRVTVSKGPELIGVPDVVNESSEEASFILGQASLEIGQITRAFSDTVPQGIVVSQSPRAGEKVAKQTEVNLVVSKGEEIISLPDVIGRTTSQATSELEQLGLRVDKSKEFDEAVEKDRIIRQSPPPGTEIRKGVTVSLVISRGPEMSKVPEVRELIEQEAVDSITKAGLSPDIQYIKGGEKGKVVEQYPAADTEAKKGSTVTIYVGS
jgi:serine/threonine-protein kinase